MVMSWSMRLQYTNEEASGDVDRWQTTLSVQRCLVPATLVRPLFTRSQDEFAYRVADGLNMRGHARGCTCNKQRFSIPCLGGAATQAGRQLAGVDACSVCDCLPCQEDRCCKAGTASALSAFFHGSFLTPLSQCSV